MLNTPFFGNFDLAQLSLYLFWLFFAGLVIWLQRENMREGYPLENEDGTPARNQGPFPLPDPKVFKLPFGRGEVMAPAPERDRREIRALPAGGWPGAPLEPTGDPMADGVGPSAWAQRRDEPELDGHGHPKIVPMRHAEGFFVSAGRDPRGAEVVAGDDAVVGTVSDLWIDKPESVIRYLEVDLGADGRRLIPMPMARLWGGKVYVRSIYSDHFPQVPRHASDEQVTKLEEEKISAFYCGGTLYASFDRSEPLI
jgi:photosynthetic reaction center H subunit